MSDSPIDVVLNALERGGCKPRKSGQHWTAHVPGREDKHPSLRVTVGKDDRVLVKDMANKLDFAGIAAALGLEQSAFFPSHPNACCTTNVKSRVVATYPYLNEKGELLFESVRYEPKRFLQRRRDTATGEWIWNLDGVRRVLYRLPELLLSDKSKWVFVVEGEKDVDRLRELGFVATTNPCGAGKWHLVDSTPLHDRRICVLVDNDDAGRKHAREIVQSLRGKTAELVVLELPNLKSKGDVSDWLDAGGTPDELMALVETAPMSVGESDSGEEGPDDNAGDQPSRSQATILAQIGQAAELFHDGDVGYASIQCDDHVQTWRIESSRFRKWLTFQFFKREGRVPNASATSDAIHQLDGIALHGKPEINTFVRLAEINGTIYLDRGDDKWRVLEIDAFGWRVVEKPPIRFRRPKGMLALPLPVHGGSLTELRGILNVSDDHQFVLVVAWLVGALRPSRPTPPLILSGEQGTAKTTAGKLLRSLIDPNISNLRAEPREVRDLMIAANNSLVVAFDNLSRLPVWLSDALCRLATGGGFSTRVLYANDEEMIFDALRPVILTSIEDVVTRADLLDRSIRVTLEVIPEEQRLTEDQLWRQFEAVRPRILGALLDAVSMAIRNLPNVALKRSPRMADFAQWVVAAEPALPVKPGEFMNVYAGNCKAAHETALEASPVSVPLLNYMESVGHWSGTMSDLLDILTARVDEKIVRDKEWPSKPHLLSGLLKRLAPSFREVGLEIKNGGRERNRTRRRLIELTLDRNQAPNSVPGVHKRPSDENQGFGGRSADGPAAPADADEPSFVATGTHVDAADANLHHSSGGEATWTV